MSYYRRCPKCGLKWNVSREAYLDPEHKCPACVGRAVRPEWRGRSVRVRKDDLDEWIERKKEAGEGW